MILILIKYLESIILQSKILIFIGVKANKKEYFNQIWMR